MGAAIGRAVGKAFLGRGLVKAGSKQASRLRLPRMSIGAMRWAGTGSYRAMVESAGTGASSAAGTAARGAGRGLTNVTRTAAGRAAARDAEGFVDIPLRDMGSSVARSGGEAIGTAARAAGRTGFRSVGRGGAIGLGTAIGGGTAGVGAGMMATRDRGGGGDSRTEPLRVTPTGDKDKPPERAPPRKNPGSYDGGGGGGKGGGGKGGGGGRRPATPDPPARPPSTGPTSTTNPTRPRVPTGRGGIPTYGEIRGSLTRPSGTLLRGRTPTQRMQTLPMPGGLDYDRIRGSLMYTDRQRQQRGTINDARDGARMSRARGLLRGTLNRSFLQQMRQRILRRPP